MRVTKTVRAYIEREVEKKLMPKYEAEKTESQRQKEALQTFLSGALQAAQDAFEAHFNKHWDEIGDFCANKMEYNKPQFYHCRAAVLRDENSYEGVHCWDRRMHTEIERVVSDIIVTLELGGGRAELEAMLNNI